MNFMGKYIITDFVKMLGSHDNILIKAVCFVDYEADRLLTFFRKASLFFKEITWKK